MSKNTSIVLGERFDAFIGAQIQDGKYGTTSEVVRAGLRLLEEHELKLHALRSALIEGEESGMPVSFDFEGFLSQKRANKHEGA